MMAQSHNDSDSEIENREIDWKGLYEMEVSNNKDLVFTTQI